MPNIPDFWTYGVALAGPPFGFGIATALAMMRLVLSGAFDAFPKLKIVLGHYGEGLPFLMQRIDWAFERPHVKSDKGALVDLKKKPSQYLRENMVVSTSGNYLPAAFKCTREALGMDKIMLGTDYPYEDMGEASTSSRASGLSAEEKEMLYGGNATRWDSRRRLDCSSRPIAVARSGVVLSLFSYASEKGGGSRPRGDRCW